MRSRRARAKPPARGTRTPRTYGPNLCASPPAFPPPRNLRRKPAQPQEPVLAGRPESPTIIHGASKNGASVLLRSTSERRGLVVARCPLRAETGSPPDVRACSLGANSSVEAVVRQTSSRLLVRTTSGSAPPRLPDGSIPGRAAVSPAVAGLPLSDKGGHQIRAADVARIGAGQRRVRRHQTACSVCPKPVASKCPDCRSPHDRRRRRWRAHQCRVGTQAAPSLSAAPLPLCRRSRREC